MVKDWSPLQEDIKKLYHIEGQPLKEVIRLIKGRHGFHASERSYRTQLQKWGYLKYSTESHPKPVSRTQKVRPKRRSNAGGTNQTPSASLSDGISRFATFQSSLPTLSLGHDSTGGLYYNAGAAVPFHSSDSALLGLNAPIPMVSTQLPLRYGFGFNEQDSDGKTLLHRATIDKSVNQVKAILDAGGSVDIKDHNGYEPLHYAAIADDLEIFELLLRFGADVNAECQLGRSPVHLAISNKQMIDLLRKHGATMSKQDDRGDTALHLALTNPLVHSKEESVIDALLSDTSALNLDNNAGFTPFHRFVDQEYNADTLKYLARALNLGADINHALPDGRLPAQIFLAKAEGLPSVLSSQMNDALKIFLSKGLDPLTSSPNGSSAFTLVLEHQLRQYHGDQTDMTLLTDICSSINTVAMSEDGNSVLHELCSRCDRFSLSSSRMLGELVDTVLNRGGNPNIQNRKGETPLLLLTRVTRRSFDWLPRHNLDWEGIIKKLLSFGADPMLQDESGKCALFQAAEAKPPLSDLGPLLIAAAGGKRPWPDLPYLDADKRVWWQNWNLAMQLDHWAEEKNLLAFRGTRSDKLMVRAEKVLAEDRLEKATKLSCEGDPDKQEAHRKYFASILRDCRTKNVRIDMKYLDYLLELCQ